MDRSFETVDWNRYAKWYDALLELRPYLVMLEDVRTELHDTLSPVLDAGCGTGNLTRILTRAGIAVVGIDASCRMLECAKAKCTYATFTMADLELSLPFRVNTFGAVACANALYALADPSRTLVEFFRVLQPGGKLVVTTPAYGYENGLILKAHCKSSKPTSYWANAHENAEREASLVHEAFADERLCEQFLEVARINRLLASERRFHFFRASELAQVARRSGFVRVRIRRTYADQNLLLTARKGLTCASN